MTNRRTDLIKALGLIQNHPAHSHHDIMTIHACAPLSTEAQLVDAIEWNMAQIGHWANYAGNRRRLANAGAAR